MLKIILFVHIVSVATWFGGTTLMSMLLRDATRSTDTKLMSQTLTKVQKWNSTMFLPLSILVLISGLFMWAQYGDSKPLWLLIKERGGSLFILLFVLFISLYGKKLLAKIKEANISLERSNYIIKRYILALNISLLIMLAIMFTVTLKI